MSFACFLTIYIIGLFLIPVGFGMWKYDDIINRWETDDYIIACFILATWPFVAGFGAGLAMALGILFAISCVFRWLFMMGAKYRKHLIEKAYRKRHPEEFVDDNTCEECDGSGK